MTDLRYLEVDYDPVPTSWQVPVYDSTNDKWVFGGNLIPFLGDAGGTANALTLTGSPTVTDLADGDLFAFKATDDNSGAATLTIDSTATEPMLKNIGRAMYPIVESDISNNQIYIVQYSSDGGTYYNLINPSAPSVMDRQAALTSFASTTTPSDLYSVTILADTMRASRGFEFDARGLIDNNTGASRSFTFRVYLGSTRFFNGLATLSVTATQGWRLCGSVSSVASLSAQFGQAELHVGGSIGGTVAGDNVDEIDSHSTMAESSTLDLTFRIEITMSAADVTTSLYHAYVRYV